MAEVTCDKCDGTGTIKAVETYCESEIQIAHERIQCYAKRQHPGKAHMALVQAPCGSCKGFDEHAEGCPDLGIVTHETRVIRWGSAGIYTFATKEEWDAWRKEYM